MEKTLGELFAGYDCTVLGDPQEPVRGLAYRSDAVQPGDMFFCIVGLVVDGHTFAQDAIDHGARTLVLERVPHLADSTGVTEAVVADSRRAMAWASARFYDEPSRSFDLVGITGTNGKTTTTYLVEAIARAAGERTGVIGTVGVTIGDEHLPSAHTTPEAPDLEALLARMRDAGCGTVAMEVSSHALDLQRVWGLDFAVTAFTNLTQDHLDYHQTFDAYFEAKALLFSNEYPAKRVIGIGDEWGRELARRCREAGDDVLTTGLDEEADIHPVAVDLGSASTTVRLAVGPLGREVELTYPLVGRFNVENVMTAFACGLQLGIDADTIVEALAAVPPVPGRLERVQPEGGADVPVYVDYAHTPDALAKAIGSVRALASGRVLVVFGCGGDRDAGKRPLMGAAALKADYAIVTSDNPRTEDPLAIIEDIVGGMRSAEEGRFEVEPDRCQAIRRAIELAAPGDIVLLAGKGHEDYQVLGSQTIHFDDREAAAEALLERGRAEGDAGLSGGEGC